ncbi:transcriptional regulator, ModE family [Beijerinckia indica subsp. indica ATCC 9039]|uniref:Transcriptional regulator, ModE family n=2 Tax=Beijerinckia TaxID=532 RepID=B2IJA3_BEII9|nr:transcriptional regulator, ModE family [Beijerinckia indica subsp. indica ATCC 9039]
MISRKIDTFLALRADKRLLISRERITLLEAVMQHGSITRGAEIAGFSYKTAWNAVHDINDLLPYPAFIIHSGGIQSGAEITEEGRRLIAIFRHLEKKLGRISDMIAEKGLKNDRDLLFWGMAMRLSTRNAFRCTVKNVLSAPINVLVQLQISPECEIAAVLTSTSVQELGLVVGCPAVVLVNASSVILTTTEEPPRISAWNKIPGTVLTYIKDETNFEVIVDIGDGMTITSIISCEETEEGDFHPGKKVWAIFKTSDVIIASD